MRIYTDMDLVAAECLRARAVGRAVARASWPRRCRRWCSRPAAPTTRRARGCPAAGSSRCSPTWSRCGPTSTPSSASTSSTSCASPTSGFAWAAYRWAEGATLDEVLAETDLAAGDFVRWMKQLLDLTDQVADAAGERRRCARRARAASAALRRGVVAYSSVSRLDCARPSRRAPCAAHQLTGRFSYGVDSTIVVRVETFAAARTRASRSSRSVGVATRTLRM